MTPLYIAGAAETPLGEVPDENEFSMVAKATREALAEAGLKRRDIDGLFVNYMGEEGSVQVAEYLGITPRYSDSTDLGGAAFEAQIHHAMAAIHSGFCEVMSLPGLGEKSTSIAMALRHDLPNPESKLAHLHQRLPR